MIVIEHSTYDEASIAAALGAPEYSYWFVRKAFRRVLEQFGVLVPAREIGSGTAATIASAARHGEGCVLFSFNPPQYLPEHVACPAIPVFAWEFDRIPDESWNANPAEDWRIPLARAGLGITHSQFAADAVRRTMGADFPVWSIPAPVASLHGSHPPPRPYHDAAPLALASAVVLDSWAIDLRLFAPGRSAQEASGALRAVRRATAARDGDAMPLALSGVVYSSVFNPGDGRKNWEDLVAGFVFAFREQPDAVLIVKLTHVDLIEAVQPVLEHIAKLGRFRCRVLLVHGLLSDAEYRELVGVTSYAVNASQGEGQCLPLMEFMAAGRPAVAPRHTAMLDYLSSDNGFVIPSHERPGFWPHDERQAHSCRRHEIAFDGYVEALRRSFATARDDADRYASMSGAAKAALQAYCGDAVVVARLADVFAFVESREAPLSPAPAPEPRVVASVDPYLLGLKDAVLSGWYNDGTGELFAGFPVGPEDVVVDVGCGDGGASAFCARQGAHVILADVDAERLEATAARLREAGADRLDVHVTDAAPLPLETASVSRVICTEVLEHVDDPVAFAAELVRVGRPGALYLITVPGAAQERIQEKLAPPSYFEKPNHIRIFEEGQFHATLREAGLVIENTGRYGFFWSLWFAMFWQTGVPLGGSDPQLQHWADTWNQVLDGRDGLRIKEALDEVLPKATVVVARKPA